MKSLTIFTNTIIYYYLIYTNETLVFALPNRPLLNTLIGGLSRLIDAGNGGCVALLRLTSRVIHPGVKATNQSQSLSQSISRSQS